MLLVLREQGRWLENWPRFLSDYVKKNLQPPPPIVVTANDLGVVGNQPNDLGWLAHACRLKSLVMFDVLLYDFLNCVAFARCGGTA